MSKQSNDPFSSAFSLLAGQRPQNHPDYALNHIEALPEDMIESAAKQSGKTPRLIALFIQILALLQLR